MNRLSGPAYSFEEFESHLDAMKQVYKWEDSVMFGDLKKRDPNSAHSARVIEYFSDTYPDTKEMGYKSMSFMNIHDYVGQHRKLFESKDLLEEGTDEGWVRVDRMLWRAVHFIFTNQKLSKQPDEISPRRVARLALAFKNIEKPASIFT